MVVTVATAPIIVKMDCCRGYASDDRSCLYDVLYHILCCNTGNAPISDSLLLTNDIVCATWQMRLSKQAKRDQSSKIMPLTTTLSVAFNNDANE